MFYGIFDIYSKQKNSCKAQTFYILRIGNVYSCQMLNK